MGGHTHNIIGILVHGVILLSIVVAAVVLGVERVINGDAIVGLLGAVAATTAGTTAYRAGTRSGDVTREDPPPALMD